MKTGLRKWHYTLLMWVLCCFAEVAVAANSIQNNQLADMGIEVQRLYGHGQPTQSLKISGDGNASLNRGNSEQTFTLTGKEFIDNVNALHRLRFMDLPEHIGPPQLLFLKQDGSVGVQVLALNDAATTIVCLCVGGNKKCTTYSETDGPSELKSWVQIAFADAVRRVEDKSTR